MVDPILVRQRPEEDARTRENSRHWIAETAIGGVTYTARSRRGAPNELARVLVAAGIPDAPMHVMSHLVEHVALRYRSFHAVAKWTYEESAHVPLRRVRWRDPTLAFRRGAEGGTAAQNGGCLPLAATSLPSDHSAAEIEAVLT